MLNQKKKKKKNLEGVKRNYQSSEDKSYWEGTLLR
jgi:hypothetical protein